MVGQPGGTITVEPSTDLALTVPQELRALDQ